MKECYNNVLCHNGVEFGEVRRRRSVCGEDSESRGLALCFLVQCRDSKGELSRQGMWGGER